MSKSAEPRFIVKRRFARWHVVDTQGHASDGIYYGKGAKARAEAACARLNGEVSPEGRVVAAIAASLCAARSGAPGRVGLRRGRNVR